MYVELPNIMQVTPDHYFKGVLSPMVTLSGTALDTFPNGARCVFTPVFPQTGVGSAAFTSSAVINSSAMVTCSAQVIANQGGSYFVTLRDAVLNWNSPTSSSAQLAIIGIGQPFAIVLALLTLHYSCAGCDAVHANSDSSTVGNRCDIGRFRV